jgi:hypothetical protein
VDALEAPPWILAGEPDDQLLYLVGDRRSAGASAAESRVVPERSTIVPVGAAGSAPRAAHGRWAASGAVDAGGAAPRAPGVIPGSRSRWPPPTGSRAGPAQGCGAAPSRRTTRPHQTSTGEGEQATAHRSPSSSSTCWSRPRPTSDTPRAGIVPAPVYKTAGNRPPGAGLCCPCSSRRVACPASALLTGRVVPGGMTSGMTGRSFIALA